jgi:TetR/AcrR family fatty acid metabolism transcriptional regulator
MNEHSFRRRWLPIRKKKDKKELIRESAIKIFANEGYYNATVKMIAQEADIAVGTIYNYFANKREILNYIFKVEFGKRIGLLNELRGQGKSLKEILTCFLKNHFSWLKDNSDTTTVLLQESRLPRKHSLEAVNSFMNELPDLFAELLDEAQNTGEIRDVDSSLIANAIFHAIRGVALKVETSDGRDDFNVARRELLNFIWVGLSAE